MQKPSTHSSSPSLVDPSLDRICQTFISVVCLIQYNRLLWLHWNLLTLLSRKSLQSAGLVSSPYIALWITHRSSGGQIPAWTNSLGGMVIIRHSRSRLRGAKRNAPLISTTPISQPSIRAVFLTMHRMAVASAPPAYRSAAGTDAALGRLSSSCAFVTKFPHITILALCFPFGDLTVVTNLLGASSMS